MKIAICDDDAAVRESTMKLLKLAYAENDLEWETPQGYDSAEALLCAVQQGERWDLLYLDIELPGISGMAAAVEIRTVDLQVQIIFVTSHDQYVFDAFRVLPLDFLPKPIDCRRFLETFRRAVDNYRLKHQNIACLCDDGIRSLRVADIVCVESAGKKAAVLMASGTVYTIKQSLAEMERQLKIYHIIRSHRSHLINLAYMRGITTRQQIPIGKRREGREALLCDPAHPEQPISLDIGKKYQESVQRAFLTYQQEGGWLYP